MNEVMEKEAIHVENMIYEIDGKEVMLDDEISATKWHVIKSLIYLVLKATIKLILYYQYYLDNNFCVLY